VHVALATQFEGDGGMVNWEYMTLDVKNQKAAVEDLNRFGAEGWEAVAMVSTWGVGAGFVHPMVLLKRPLPQATPSQAA
jgi:hypothetical protein